MADELQDSYRILQIEPGASLPTVKRAYRNLVKMWHPDHFAPGSKMELKAQEKLKDINLAYEKLCKSRGQDATGDSDSAEQNKKARKPAASSDEEPNTARRSSSRKAEEEPFAAGRKGPSRKVGDLDDDEPVRETPPPPAGKSKKTPGLHPFRRAREGWAQPKIRRTILLGAAVVVAGLILKRAIPRHFWADWLKPAPAAAVEPANSASAPEAAAVSVAAKTSKAAPAGEASEKADKALAATGTPTVEPASIQKVKTASIVAGDATGQVVGGAPGQPPGLSPAGSSPGTADLSASARAAAIAPAFTVGSTKEQVIEVQGKPDSYTETRFQYGSSEVTFRGGQVESWREGNPPLKARKPSEFSALNFETFTIGSRKDEVVAVQGKPDLATDSAFHYGSSVVFFRHDRVESWSNGNPRLKTRALSNAAATKLATFTIGSRKDKVVEVQGLPEKFTDASFQYGSSTVFFTNGRVASWVSGDPPLKAKNPDPVLH